MFDSFPDEQFVSTTVSRRILAWATAAHRRRRISIISGPPGIGKTESILQFAKANAGNIAVVKVARKNASPTMVLRDVADSLKQLVPGNERYWVPGGLYELRNNIHASVCGWAGMEPARVRLAKPPVSDFGLLTVIIDEAQNLSKDAIEVLRFWNDADNCYAPMPIGLVFVGNKEFLLQPKGPTQQSVLSAAVADRAIFSEILEYEDVADDDLVLYAESRGVTDPEALAAILAHFRPQKTRVAIRSFRRLRDAIEEAILDANGGTVTAELLVRHLR